MKPETQDRAPGIIIDRALLDRARAKDREALGLLYEASSLEIYRTIHALIRDEDLTLDIQQDTYLQAFSHLDQLREPESFLPWLKQIAVNQARAQLRRKRPTLFTELTPTEEGEEPEFPDLSPQTSPELSLDRKETTRLVREILDGLTDGQRLLVGMYYYEELSMPQIAQELGLSLGTVKSQLHRSRKHVETEVRKLEAQGVKLYGLGPLPFLLALLHRAEPSAEAEGKLLAASVSQSAPALETAAVHVGRSFFQTALGRVTLGLMAAAVVGGGVIGWRWYQNHLERVMGDYRPTVYLDSAEDLSTEPTEPTETHPKPDSGEDLIHVPTLHIPTPTEPTEPTETEPASIAPPETTPPKATDPAGPPDPGSPPATTPTKPTPQPTEPVWNSNTVSWEWEDGGGMDWHCTAGDSGFTSRMLYINVYNQHMGGGPVWAISTDDEDTLQITRIKDQYLDYNAFLFNGYQYHYSIRPKRAGTARVLLTVNGEIAKQFTVTAEVPQRLVSASVEHSAPYYGYMEQTMANCTVGMEYVLGCRFLGSQPVFTTDNSAVVRLGPLSTYTENSSPVLGCSVPAEIIGPGNANIYLSLNGKVEKTWAIHAVTATVDRSDSQEDLIPVDAEPQVMSWYANTYHFPLLIRQGSPDMLYVKIKGPDAPSISVDNASVLSVRSDDTEWYEDRNVSEHWFQLTALGSGICTLTCSFQGKVVFTIPIVVP